ncbi:hypothetical protein, partial [Sediminivirga luteola]|uniref:hypothetical protein n=1 Tax=Sediminivirga luteola TaxID=1774748 RepID=UPI001F20526D
HPQLSPKCAAVPWSPVRTHHAKFPQGVAGSEWGLKLTLTEREDSEDGIEQTAFVFLTFRGLEEGLPVHSDGIAAVRQLSLWNTRLAQRTSVTVSTLQ